MGLQTIPATCFIFRRGCKKVAKSRRAALWGENQLGSCKPDPVYPTGPACTLEETLNTKKEVVLLEMHL